MRALLILLCLGGSRGGQILQLTDFHWDSEYDAAKGIPPPKGTCRRNKASVTASTAGLGAFGTYGCDSPGTLVRHAIAEMKLVVQHPDLIIWSGDSMPHIANNLYSADDVVGLLANLTKLIRDTFPGVPLFPVFGNHDYWPSGDFPAANGPIYARVAADWAPYVPPQATMNRTGYYAVTLPTDPSVLLIGLNTNLYFFYNHLGVTTDPGGQLRWLRAQCASARAARQQVLISAHVPPGWDGYNVMKPPYNAAYLAAIANCSDVLLPMLYGHEHADRLLLQRSANGSVLGAYLMAPPILPDDANPAFRVFTYTSGPFQFTDAKTYVMNLSLANSGGDRTFKAEYSFAADYGVSPITPASLGELGDRLASNASLFRRYWRNIKTGHARPACDAHCRKLEMCRINNPDFPRHDVCISGSSRAKSLPYLLDLLIPCSAVLSVMSLL